MRTLYALVSAQGTCCLETVLTAEEYADPAQRARIEANATGDRLCDPPTPGTWTDVTENEAAQAMFDHPEEVQS